MMNQKSNTICEEAKQDVTVHTPEQRAGQCWRSHGKNCTSAEPCDPFHDAPIEAGSFVAEKFDLKPHEFPTTTWHRDSNREARWQATARWQTDSATLT
jgi:hypothetical protein